jgi:predicted outer membrane repeat protein
VSQDEGDLLLLAQIGKPVPGEHALTGDDEPLAEGLDRLEEGRRAGGGTFSGNSASDSGGAIYNAGTATIQESTLSGNSAGSAGGGIFNTAFGTLALKDTTVLNDVAPSGADVYNLGSLTLDDSTVGVIGP